MQSVSSRIWTRIVVSNSYDDNHYTTVIVARNILMKIPSGLLAILDIGYFV